MKMIDVIEKTTPELEVLKVEVEMDLARIKEQLDEAAGRAASGG